MTEREKEFLTLILVAPLFLGVVLAVVAGLLSDAGAWLVDHQILVGPSEAVIPVPGLDGPGLDSTRLLLVSLSGAVLVAGLVWAITRHQVRRRQAMQ